MTFKTTLLAGTVIAAFAAAPAAAQQISPTQAQAQIEALNQQIQALQSQVRSLAEKMEKEVAAVDKKVTALPTVSVDGGRMRIRSADRAHDMAIRARLHFDYGHWFPGQNNTNDYQDGFGVRRAFLGVNGTVFTDWGYEFTANFAGNRGGTSQIQAANISYRGVKDWVFIAGVSQPKMTLDDSTSSNDIPFIERASIVNNFVGVAGSDSRTLVGFTTTQMNGALFLAGYLTGDQTGQTGAFDDQANLVGRAAFRAFEDNQSGIGIGTSGFYQFEPRQAAGAGQVPALPTFTGQAELRPGAQNVTLTSLPAITGRVDSVYGYGADIGAYFKNFWAAAEYYTMGLNTNAASNYNDPSFDGYYIAAGWVLTGERRRWANGEWGGVRPSWPVGQRGMGAWEIAVRYSVVNTDDEGSRRSGTLPANAAVGEHTVWTFGVNWYLNPAVRVMANYIMAESDRVGTRPDVKTDAAAVRLQFQF